MLPPGKPRSRTRSKRTTQSKGGPAKQMKTLLVGLLAIPFLGVSCVVAFAGLYSMLWAIEAQEYNRTVLAAYETPESNSAVAQRLPVTGLQPTLAPVQANVWGESFSLVDENAPVAFANYGESFTLVASSNEVTPLAAALVAPNAPTPTPSSTAVPRYPPVWISIPSIALSTTVEAVSLKQEVSDGPWFWGTPEKTVGWHEGTGVPGESQAIEFNGHVRWKGKAGIFWRLHKVTLEDEIVLTSSDGRNYTYLVRQVRIFSASGEEGLSFIRDLENRHEELVVLTTCINWSDSKRIYTDRLIVVAVKGETN